MKLIRSILSFILISVTCQAFAAQWTGYFPLSAVYIASAENYHVRAHGMPTSICTSGWAYVNKSDPGSGTYVAALLLAHASAKQVNLYVAQDSSSYCHILEFQIIN